MDQIELQRLTNKPLIRKAKFSDLSSPLLALFDRTFENRNKKDFL